MTAAPDTEAPVGSSPRCSGPGVSREPRQASTEGSAVSRLTLRAVENKAMLCTCVHGAGRRMPG